MSDERAPAVRLGDAEREHGITVLRDAVVEGRLTLEEFSDRVGRVQVARTDAELAELLADLPAAPLTPGTAPAEHRAVFSRIVRSGMWELPPRAAFRSIFGTIHLDLRQATLPGEVVEIDIFNLFGTVTLIVPEGIRTSVTGGGMFASQVLEPSFTPAPPAAPRLHIRVSGPGGTLYVRSHPDPGALPRA